MNWVVVSVLVAQAWSVCQGAYQQYEYAEPRRPYQGPPVVPVILPGGYIADTEEVAKAKELHFNALANAATSVKDSRYNPPEQRYTQVQPVAYQQPLVRPQVYNLPQQQQYTGPASGSTRATYTEPRPVPAPAHEPVVNYQQPAYSSQPRYQGPPVIPVILPNGYIAETADVEAAKEHHFQLVAQAQAAVARAQERANSRKYGYTGPTATYEDDGSQYEDPEQNYNQVYTAAPAPSRPVYTPQRKAYAGPPVVPVVLPSGHIADTAEVAAAKISHLQQLLDAAQKSQPQQHYHAVR